jgi:hypothetical protein
MVSKQSDRPYRAGRSRDWVKVQNRRHHAFDRVNRLLQARVDGGDGIDVGHGSSEVDAIAIKRGRDHVVAHHGHALDVHDAARRRVTIVVTAVLITIIRGDLAAEAIVVEVVMVEVVMVEAVMIETVVAETVVAEAVSLSRRGCGRHTAGDGERNRGESGNLGFDRHVQSPSDLCAAVVAHMLYWTEVFDFGSKVAGAAAVLV